MIKSTNKIQIGATSEYANNTSYKPHTDWVYEP